MTNAATDGKGKRRKMVVALLICLGMGLVLWVVFNILQIRPELDRDMADWKRGILMGRAVMSAVVAGCVALVPWLCVVLVLHLPARTTARSVLWVALTVTGVAIVAGIGLVMALLLLMSFQY